MLNSGLARRSVINCSKRLIKNSPISCRAQKIYRKKHHPSDALQVIERKHFEEKANLIIAKISEIDFERPREDSFSTGLNKIEDSRNGI